MTNMQTEHHNRFVSRTLPSFCQAVALPDLPSPTGGAVLGVTGALLASLSELVMRVTSNHVPHWEKRQEWKKLIDDTEELRFKLLTYAEEDIYEAEKLIRGQVSPCLRKQIAVPAKLASHLVKVLQALEQVADRLHQTVWADARVVAHLGRGVADGIYEIEVSNIMRKDGGDSLLLQRIAQWRHEAHLAVDGILAKTNGTVRGQG